MTVQKKGMLFVCLWAGVACMLAEAMTVMPARPRVNQPLTFTVSPPPAMNCSTITWNFGDGRGTIVLTGNTAMHAYLEPGTYLVQAQCLTWTDQLSVTVLPGQGPQAPFAIAFMRLRFADGKTSASVVKDFQPLLAYADLKYEGTGFLQLQWLVDDMPFKLESIPLTFAKQTDDRFGPGAVAAHYGSGQARGEPEDPAAGPRVFAAGDQLFCVGPAQRRTPAGD